MPFDAMRSQTLWNPRIGLSIPTEAGNTSSPIRVSDRSTSHAACDKGRSDAPVFVSVSFAVRATRSISDHFSASISPLRQPVTARNRVAATATGQVVSGIVRRASPSAAYSASDRRRLRWPSAWRSTPRTGLSARSPRLTANEKMAPSIPKVRVAVPRPPVTRASPCLPVLMRADVAPSVTASRNRSMSPRVTAAAFNDPNSGLICLSTRPLSPRIVLAFLASLRRVQDASCPATLDIRVAELGDRRSLACLLFRCRGVAAFCGFSEKPLCLSACLVRRPWRAVTPDSRPALPTVRSPILDDIRNRCAPLAARAEP